MEVRLPRRNWKLTPHCIVCAKPAAPNGKYTVKYTPDVLVDREDQDFTMEFMLCEEHFALYQQGKRKFQRSLLFFGLSLVPFLLAAWLNDKGFHPALIYSLFILALGLCIGGYFLFIASGKLSEKTVKNKAKIKWISRSEILLEINNPEWGELQKKVR